MRLKFHKEIEFFLKKVFFSQSFLLKRRLDRAIKNNEENEIELVKKFSDKNYDSIDIGVYRGVYTYEMSKYSKIVHSFEANPILFDNLKKNFSKLRNNIILYNYALSDQNEKVEYLYIRNYHGFRGEDLDPKEIDALIMGGSVIDERYKPDQYTITGYLNELFKNNNYDIKLVNAGIEAQSTAGIILGFKNWLFKGL